MPTSSFIFVPKPHTHYRNPQINSTEKKTHKLFFILTVVYLLHSTISPKSLTISTTKSCLPNMKEELISWTKRNHQEYALITSPDILLKARCQTILIQMDKLPVSLMWMDLPLLSPLSDAYVEGENETCELLLIRDSKLMKWDFATNPDIPNFASTCNAFIQAEFQDPDARNARISALLKKIVFKVANAINPEEYYWIQENIFISELLWLDQVKMYDHFVIFTIAFERYELFISQNFANYLKPVLKKNASMVYQKVKARLAPSFTDLFSEQMFERISKDRDFVKEEFSRARKALSYLIHTIKLQKLDVVGKNKPDLDYILYELNCGYNQLSVAKLTAFSRSYAGKVLENKPEFDIVEGFIKRNVDTPEVTDRVIAIALVGLIANYKSYNIQFIMINKMESKGYLVKESTNGFANLFKYGFSKKNNCDLDDETKKHLINLAVNQEWLNSDYFYTSSEIEIFRRCSKVETRGRMFYSVLVNPNNTARCEIVFQVPLKDEEYIIISNTSRIYWYGVSCNRYTKELMDRHEMLKENFENDIVEGEEVFMNPYMFEDYVMSGEPIFLVI